MPLLPALPRVRPGAAGIVFCLAVLAGCGESGDDATTGAPAPPTESAAATPIQKPGAEEAAPSRFDWGSLLKAAEGHLAGNQLDQAQSALKKLGAAKQELSADQSQQLAALTTELSKKRKQDIDRQRAATMDKARQAVEERQLEQATQALETVLANNPTAEQTAEAAKLQARIQESRKVRRELRVAMQMLNSDKRGDVRAAQQRLWQDLPDALPLLIESVGSDNAVLAKNAMELLRRANQPQRVLPALVSVLANPKQSKIWDAAVQELGKVAHPGAGEKLLQLVAESKQPAQRAAALKALAGVVDPPRQSISALLPLIAADGPELAAALAAAAHTVEVNQQHDLFGLRNVDGELTTQQAEFLAALPQRLTALIGKIPPEGPTPVAAAALRLGLLTGQVAPEPLPGVKVSSATGEDPASPATAVLDGIWNSIDAKTMWYHPLLQQPTEIVLDLGGERTVTGIRLWNLNLASNSHRGWKDLYIFVSENPSPLDPVASAVVPPAPAVADPQDYSTLVPIAFAKGRYVKLQLIVPWTSQGYAGLSEVQVLGY